MRQLNTKAAYVAVKLKGLPHFLWFERGRYRESATQFAGCDGWGPGGALTHAGGALDQIEARLFSDELSYE